MFNMNKGNKKPMSNKSWATNRKYHAREAKLIDFLKKTRSSAGVKPFEKTRSSQGMISQQKKNV